MKKKDKVGYLKLIYRIVISLPVSVFFVLYGSGISVFNALFMAGFYYSVIGSFIISVIIVNIIHYTTIYLDARLNWVNHFLLRLLWQFLLCFLAPSLLTYVAAAFYFKIFGIDINSETKYLTFDFPWVLALIALLNIYYFLYYLLIHSGLQFELYEGRVKILHEHKTTPLKDNQEPSAMESAVVEKTSLPSLIMYQGNTAESVDAGEKVAFFYYARNYYWAKTFDGHSLAIKQNLSEIENMYCGRHFFRINRKIIINRIIATGYYKNKNGKYMVRLPELQSEEHPLVDHSQFCLSSRKVPKFLKWLQEA